MIVEASVNSLFGTFDHRIRFQEDWEFLIAFGLNVSARLSSLN